jgi:hypothetical protein
MHQLDKTKAARAHKKAMIIAVIVGCSVALYNWPDAAAMDPNHTALGFIMMLLSFFIGALVLSIPALISAGWGLLWGATAYLFFRIVFD